jgi:CRP-like cAMP-binding protein
MPAHRLVDGLSEESRRALAAICRPRALRRREVLFHEGTPGQAVFILQRGRIQLHKAGPDGSEVVIKTLRPPEVFAEVILFEEDFYPVTATALAPSAVLVMARRDVHELLRRADFRRDFIAMLMRKQRYLTERIVRLTAHGVPVRLVMFLLEEYGPSPVLQLTMSKKDMAAAIGITPETLSRAIGQLRRQGLCAWTGKTIRWQVNPARWLAERGSF